jgi:hypothetical protein
MKELLWHFMMELRKIMKTSVRIVSVPAEICTEKLLNTSLKRYCHINRFAHVIGKG